ncbi:MAG: hypothetical protein E6G76_13425 [Alphaproteobacteria bacterium]|nr:MAG: hypothetical protein E6G76_13425 [Alphaproteobacteria bacterium]
MGRNAAGDGDDPVRAPARRRLLARIAGDLGGAAGADRAGDRGAGPAAQAVGGERAGAATRLVARLAQSADLANRHSARQRQWRLFLRQYLPARVSH